MKQHLTAGVIRVITLQNKESAEVHARLIEKFVPSLHTKTVCLPDQPTGVHNAETEAQAEAKILQTARELGNVDVVILSCAGDPGLDILQSELNIPVIGAGSAAAALCTYYGNRPGILGITDEPPTPFRRAFGGRLINLGRPAGVSCTLDLLTEQGEKSVMAHAHKLKEAGADCIALACTGMGAIRIGPRIAQSCGLPVIDPIMAEAVMAYYACLQEEANRI